MFAMTRLRVQIAVIVGAAFAALLALAAFSSTADAEHSWETYHWGSKDGAVVTLQLGDNVTGDNVKTGWDGYLRTASSSSVVGQNDWNDSAKLDTTVATGGSNPKRCAATSGRVEVCNSKYGSNGWLGLASIWISGGHIVQGTAKMNDTYFNTAKYNTPGWKHLVMCQEVGHTFGLGHVDETYDTANTGSCMDYTNDPDGGAGGASETDTTNEYPGGDDPTTAETESDHDYKQLDTIYSHATDTKNTYNSTSAASSLPAAARAIDPSDPAQRGRLIHRSSDGGVEIYERDFGQGTKVITRVIRATDGTPALGTNGGGGSGHNHADHEH